MSSSWAMRWVKYLLCTALVPDVISQKYKTLVYAIHLFHLLESCSYYDEMVKTW